MKQNIRINLWATLVLLSISALGANAQLDEGVLLISFVNQDPDPVEPGSYVDVRWRVQNLGTEPVNDIVIELQPAFPFSLDPSQEAVREIKLLDSLQKDDRAVVIRYRLRVDANAVQGDNQVSIRYRSGQQDWTTKQYDLAVRALDANLAIISVETNPETILPGQVFDLKIRVKNMADSVIKDVSLGLDMLLSTISGGSAAASKSDILDALPFAPLRSASEKRIRSIEPGSEVVFTYSLIAYADAQAKVYKVPIVLGFYDLQGNEYSKTDVVGVVVSAKPDIYVVLDRATAKQTASRGEVTLRFVNKGLTDVKFVDVILERSDDYDVLSSEEVYIGNIDSDDYETADFDIFVKGEGESIPLRVSYEFMNWNNEKVSRQAEIELRLCQPDDPRCNGKSGNTALVIMLIVVAAIAGLIIWRVFRKRKR